MNVAALIARFATGSYTVTRTVASTYSSAGILVPGGTSQITIQACIEPTSGLDLEVAAASQIDGETRALYTTSQLVARSPANDPDIVTIDSEPWVVFNAARWQAFDGVTVYRCLLARKLTV
jgi:hypothetical protein